MRITFEGQNPSEAVKFINNNKPGKSEKQDQDFSVNAMSAMVDIGNNQMNIPGLGDEKHSLLAGVSRDAALGADAIENYQVVMTHTLSGEDLKKAEEDGFDLKNMFPEETITILDKVKAEVAKGGAVVSGFNDDLDDSVLSDASNAGLESIINDALKNAGLPVTDENIKAVENAVELASGLTAPSENEMAYMIENDLDTTIRDFYVAQNAAPGTGAETLKDTDFDAPDMKNIRMSMQEVGSVLEDENEGYEKAKWLYNRDLPVTEENILKEKKLEDTVFPIDEREAAIAAANAIAKGLSAELGDVGEKESIYEKAVRYEEKYFSEEFYEKSDIKARRQIEEIRLSMTAEVNVTLIKSGFAIDTAPIEQLLNELKAAEQAVALKYFPETAGAKDHDDNAPSMSIGSPEDAVRAYRLMNAVNEAVTEIASSPASSLGVFAVRPSAEIAFGEFERIALGEKEKYARAGESYEALMTEVRRDLGDSFSKAFESVDSLLEGLGLDINDENRRCVKILAYNSMEITSSNIKRIEEAETKVREVIGKMKPAAVLDMIRGGVNPLEKSFDEIDEFLDSRNPESGYEKLSESYAQYLYSLDKNKEITPEEREAYIGIFRMINKIESMSGAAIGAVVDTGMSLEFNNLLSAVRTRHSKGMDVKIDENTGLAEILTAGRSITNQIMGGFSSESAEYYEETASDLRQMASFSGEALSFVDNLGIEPELQNLAAAESLLSLDESFVKALAGEDKNKTREAKGLDDFKEIAENAMDDMADAEDGAQEYARILEKISEIAGNMTFEAGSVIDVRAMQQVNRQISVLSRAVEAQADEYYVPVEIGGEVTGVRVSFEKGEASSSSDISFKTPSGSVCRAHIEVWDESVTGLISVNSGEEVKDFEKVADIFSAHVTDKGFNASNIKVVSAEAIYERDSREAVRVRPEGAGRKQLFEISRDFLKAVKENYL